MSAVAKSMSNKIFDEASVVAELLQHVPGYFPQTPSDNIQTGSSQWNGSEVLEGYNFHNAS